MPANYVPIEELKNRRSKLVEMLPANSVVVWARNTLSSRNSDVEYTFRQESNFWYLTGIDEVNCVLMICKTSNISTSYLFIPKQDVTKILWTGPTLTLEQAKNISGIDNLLTLDNFESEFKSTLSKCESCYFDNKLSNSFKINSLVDSVFDFNTNFGLQNKVKFSKSTSLLSNLRLIKSPWEISQLIKSNQIALEAHQKVQNIYTKSNQMFMNFNLKLFFITISK